MNLNVYNSHEYQKKMQECIDQYEIIDSQKAEIDRLKAEVERLRGLLVHAYNEGFEDGDDRGCNYPHRKRDAYWAESVTKAELDKAGRGE